MAVDVNFLIFLVPAILVAVTALVALPSRRRIEKDPSTAFKRGKRAMVNLVSIFAMVMGVIIALFGGTLNVKPVAANINMVQVGGISLMAMGLVLIIAAIQIRRLVRMADRGTHEEVLEVGAIGSERVQVELGDDRRLPPRPYPPREWPERGDGPRYDPYKGGEPPLPRRVRQPPDGGSMGGLPPERDRPLPPREYPPRRRPPSG